MKIEKTWTTKEGFKAAILFVDNSHRCGYVGFEKNHWAYGSQYDYFIWSAPVHGGLTFSGELPNVDKNLWWLGFDCAHSGDKTRWGEGIERTLEFCMNECEDLSAQINILSGTSFEHLVMYKKTSKKLPTNIHNKMIALSLVDDEYAIEYCKLIK